MAEVMAWKPALELGCSRRGVLAGSAAMLLAPSVGTAQAIGIAGIADQLGDYVDRAAALGWEGLVLVSIPGQQPFAAARGFADRARRLPFTLKTRFPLSSVDKPITATAILQLVSHGRLRLSDRLSQFVADLPADRQAITIEQMLTHTSGLPTYSGPDDEAIDRSDFIQRLHKLPLVHQPGAAYSYSNMGFSVLALIIELITNLPLPTHLRRTQFDVVGMPDTGWHPSAVNEQLCGYLLQERECRRVAQGQLADGPGWNMRGNSGDWSTLADLSAWARAYLNGALLPPPLRQAAMAPHVPRGKDGGGGFTGYPWVVTQSPWRDTEVSHSGGDGSVGLNLRMFPASGIVIVEFTNNSWGPDRFVRNEVAAIVHGRQPEPLPAGLKVKPAALARFTGVYHVGNDVIRVEASDGELKVPLESIGAARLLVPIDGSAEDLRRAQRMAQRIIIPIDRGNIEPLLALVPKSTDLADERKFWTETWPAWKKQLGRFVGVRAVAGFGAERSAPVLIHFERGVRWIWLTLDDEGRLTDEIKGDYLLPADFRFVQVGRNSFETYNFKLRRSTRIRFEGDRLFISAWKRTLVARRR